MNKFHTIGGQDLLERLLNVADEEGRMVIDKTTYMPDVKHYEGRLESFLSIDRLCALMKAFGVNPLLDKDFIDERSENYLICFVSEDFSDKRKEQTCKHLIEVLGDLFDVSTISDSLSTRLGRFECLRYLFRYRKKLWKFYKSNGDMVEIWDSIPKMESKCLIDLLFEKQIEPACSYLDKAMLLLMGDYVDKEFHDAYLIKDFGYPGFVSEGQNEDNDILNNVPF